MGFVKEFREFAVKGNVMDLAIGVIIGAAFAKIIDSFVKDILMPIIGIIAGPQGFKNSYVVLGGGENITKDMSLDQARETGANVLAWGSFLTMVVDFILIAIILFTVVKTLNRLRSEPKTNTPV